MEMNEIIKRLRKERGLTLEDVGNKVGVGKSTVRKWENGDIANMRRDKIAKLADALGTTPAYLMGWEEDITFSETSSGIINIEDELKSLLSRIETSHIVKYGDSEMNEPTKIMLKNSLDGLLQSLELIMKK